MSSEPEKKIVLVSSDKETFEVDMAVAEQSMTLKLMFGEEGISGAFPLSEVNSRTLAKVLEYSKKQLAGEEEEEQRRTWEEEFVDDLDLNALLDLVLAANYLEHDSLLKFSCQRVANIIKDKPVEEVRQIFNITNVDTPEEEEQLRQQTPWVYA